LKIFYFFKQKTNSEFHTFFQEAITKPKISFFSAASLNWNCIFTDYENVFINFFQTIHRITISLYTRTDRHWGTWVAQRLPTPCLADNFDHCLLFFIH